MWIDVREHDRWSVWHGAQDLAGLEVAVEGS